MAAALQDTAVYAAFMITMNREVMLLSLSHTNTVDGKQFRKLKS